MHMDKQRQACMNTHLILHAQLNNLFQDVPIFWPPSVTSAHGILELSTTSNDIPSTKNFFTSAYKVASNRNVSNISYLYV